MRGIVLVLALCVSSSSVLQHVRLVSIEQLPQDGETCLPEEAVAAPDLFATLKANSVYAAQSNDDRALEVNRSALRTIQDTDSIYTAVAVDSKSNEVFLQDNNKWAIRVFDRLENTPPNARLSEPKRVISGPKTQLQFNSAVYIDPNNGDVYSVENDTGDSIVVFNHDANGDVEPIRELHVAHRGFAVAVDEEKQEILLSVNNPPQVAVYRKSASGEEKPVRVLRGERTRLADAHGIAIDPKNKLLLVNNWGSFTTEGTVSGGRSDSGSITVYSMDAKGDTAP